MTYVRTYIHTSKCRNTWLPIEMDVLCDPCKAISDCFFYMYNSKINKIIVVDAETDMHKRSNNLISSKYISMYMYMYRS